MAKSYPTTEMCDGAFLELFEATARDTDVFLTTSAKCGQTWLQTLLLHLKTRGLDPDMGGQGLFQRSPWLELPARMMDLDTVDDRQERLARFEALEDPRVFKMHVVWDEVPRPEGCKARVMTITRDPRDIPYSMFGHLQAMRPRPGFTPPEDFDSYFESWMDLGFYWTFLASFWPHRDEEDVLILRYEDLQKELRAQVAIILDFLGWECSDEDISRVLPLVDFAHMRSREKSQFFTNQKTWKEDGRFFREGGLGKNRARLSPEQERRIIDRTYRDLGEECAAFVLSLGD